MQAPTLNHDVYYEEGQRSRPSQHRRGNPVETPYNSRLPSSTPHGSPPMRRRAPEPQYYPPPNEANSYDPYSQHSYAVTSHMSKAEKFANDRGYSLYSDRDDYRGREKPDQYQHGMKGHGRPPMHPFIPDKNCSYPVMQARMTSVPNAPTTDEEDVNALPLNQKSIDISQLTREQLLHAALKVALEANHLDPGHSYRKSRPLSPFKPGVDGFSRPKRDKSLPLPRQQESQTSLATEATSVSAVTSDTDVTLRHVASDGLRRLYFDPNLRDSVAELRIPERHAASADSVVAKGFAGKPLVGRTTKSDGNVIQQQQARRVATKNKKTQFNVAPKKQKPAASTKDSGAGNSGSAKSRKPVKTASKNKSVGSTSTHSIAVQADDCDVNTDGEHVTSTDAQVQTAQAASNHKSTQVAVHVTASRVSISSATSAVARQQQQQREESSAPPSASVSVTSGEGGAKTGSAAVETEEKEIDGRKIMKELDDRVKQIKQDLQSDLEHSMEPLREENTQLRKKVQSLTDQLQNNEAEKPEGEFTVAQLQMHNFNLENEMKSQRTLVSKLKDEVGIYQSELEKLLAEKARLMATENGGGNAQQLSNVNEKLKENCDAMQEKLATTSRENANLAEKLQKLNFEHAQKDQEMSAMQQLVGSLQDSMKKLLVELQKDSSLPPNVTQSLLMETLFKKLPGQTDAPREELQAHSRTPSRNSSSTSFKRTSHTPPNRDVSAGNLPQREHSDTGLKKPADSTPNQAQMPGSNISPYAATEYNAYPGMSPMPASAFEKLDPMIRDMIFSRRDQQQQQQHQQSHHSSNGSHNFKSPSRTSITNVTSLPTIGESDAFDSTGPTVKELLTPLADRMQRMTSAGEANDDVMRARRAINFDDGPLPERVTSQSALHEKRRQEADNSDDSFSMAIKRDLDKLHYDDSSSTLVSDIDSKSSYDVRSLDGAETKLHRAQSSTTRAGGTTSVLQEESRYSVTDYFNKYPEAMTSLSQQQAPANGAGMKDGRWREDHVFESPQADANSSSHASPQVELYRGTDLDTSLSTIDSSGTTTGSISSVDDRMFRQGLANLDANIERVQKTLRSGLI